MPTSTRLVEPSVWITVVGRWVVVSICRVPAGLVTAPVRLAAFPAPSLIVAVPRLTAVTARSAVFWPVPTVYLKVSALVPVPPV